MLISEKYRKLRGDFIYHYTDIRNSDQIKNHMTLFPQNDLRSNGISPFHITDESSRHIDRSRGFADYVFFVFTSTHPFVYKQEQNGVGLIRVKVDISILDTPGVMISDRVATDNAANFYTPKKALKKLDIQHTHGGFVEKEIWTRVKKYEILIPGNVDLKKFYRK